MKADTCVSIPFFILVRLEISDRSTYSVVNVWRTFKEANREAGGLEIPPVERKKAPNGAFQVRLEGLTLSIPWVTKVSNESRHLRVYTFFHLSSNTNKFAFELK